MTGNKAMQAHVTRCGEELLKVIENHFEDREAELPYKLDCVLMLYAFQCTWHEVPLDNAIEKLIEAWPSAEKAVAVTREKGKVQ